MFCGAAIWSNGVQVQQHAAQQMPAGHRALTQPQQRSVQSPPSARGQCRRLARAVNLEAPWSLTSSANAVGPSGIRTLCRRCRCQGGSSVSASV
jgi:hypothetical protein